MDKGRFSGKTCGMCNKGKLREFTDEVAPGVRVDAYKCYYCGEVSYSREVMVKVEAMRSTSMAERHLVKVGASVAALIPSAIVKKLKMKPKERIFVSEHGGKITIVPSGLQVGA